jgi:hypothetical protein
MCLNSIDTSNRSSQSPSTRSRSRLDLAYTRIAAACTPLTLTIWKYPCLDVEDSGAISHGPAWTLQSQYRVQEAGQGGSERAIKIGFSFSSSGADKVAWQRPCNNGAGRICTSMGIYRRSGNPCGRAAADTHGDHGFAVLEPIVAPSRSPYHRAAFRLVWFLCDHPPWCLPCWLPAFPPSIFPPCMLVKHGKHIRKRRPLWIWVIASRSLAHYGCMGRHG